MSPALGPDLQDPQQHGLHDIRGYSFLFWKGVGMWAGLRG